MTVDEAKRMVGHERCKQIIADAKRLAETGGEWEPTPYSDTYAGKLYLALEWMVFDDAYTTRMKRLERIKGR